MSERAEEGVTDFSFDSVLFQSDRLAETVELKESVTDLDIFEHIMKPYLTAVVAFTDSGNMISGTDVLGAERITIKLKSSRKDAQQIRKTFYIDKIKINHKVNDNSQYVVFHLIEDIGYIANLQNLNKSYRGKCTEIIQKIGNNFLSKDTYSTETDKQAIKVIVPNLNPLEAMSWIARRASTVDGYPFFLYSTLSGEKLIFSDLGTLIGQPPLNTDIPYRYWAGASQSGDKDTERRTIREYDQENTEDLFSLIQKGLVGSEYNYIDTLKNKKNTFHFDVTKDLLQPLVKNGVLNKNNGNVMYSPDYSYDGKSFNEWNSRRISVIGGSSAYDNQSTKSMSYGETESIAEYKLRVISRAVIGFLRKAPMQITLNGLDFIDGDVNTATGNNIRLEYLKSTPEDVGNIEKLDTKKSGDYLIIGTQYMFKREACMVRLSCAKLGNMRL